MLCRRLSAFFLLTSLAFATAAEARFPARLQVDRRFPDDVTASDWGQWNMISGLPTGIDTSRLSAYERSIGSGLHADNAWRDYTSGDPRVLIAIFDSGIQWDEADLINKHFLNAGELPLPRVNLITPHPGVDSAGVTVDCTAPSWHAGVYDANGDGVFNIADYRCDSRVHPEDGVKAAAGLLDPSDLIHATDPDFLAMNGVDDEGNGFVDDISGWDFFWDDNDPYDDTRYSHGTGEAHGAAGEADNGMDSAGVCPDCMVMNIRVSDSYVADSNHFAAGIVFAVDQGAMVINSALGTLTGTIAAQAAIDYALDKGRVVVTSAADETSMHAFPISAGERTVMVHAVVPDNDHDGWATDGPRSFLRFSNCTNFGTHLYLSAPSTSCSSGAVELTSGAAGLLYSYAMQNNLMPLTGYEVQQLLRAGANDIDDPAAAKDPEQFPSQPGWDLHFGYGRLNVENALKLMKQDRIPPEANLDAPRWFSVIDPSRTPRVKLRGWAAAPRSKSFHFEISYAQGEAPLEGDFIAFVNGDGGSEGIQDFGEWDLSHIEFDAAKAYGPISSGDAREKINQFTFTLRLRVTDAEGHRGEYRKAVYLRHDPDLLPGFPIDVGSSGESSPKLADIDNDGEWDIVLALADGSVNVYRQDGTQPKGWPAHTRLRDGFDGRNPAKQENQTPGYRTGKLPPLHSGIIASPAIGKLDGKHLAVVIATLDGDVYAFDTHGAVLPGFPQHIDPVGGADTNSIQILDDGYFSSPVLFDLNGDGTLEIIAAAMDGQLYVYDAAGNRVAPFPIELRDKTMTAPDELVDDPAFSGCKIALEQLAKNRFKGGGYRSRIIATPAIGDIDGDKRPEIVVSSSEFYPSFCDSDDTDASGSSRMYAFRIDGSQPPGFPLNLAGHRNILPYVGRGTPSAPALADLNGDGLPDIATHQIAQLSDIGAIDWTGKNVFKADQNRLGSESNVGTGGVYRAAPYPVFINLPTFGDLDNDGIPDLFVGGLTMDMLVSLSSDGRRRDSDHLLLGFSGKDGKPLPGFPRVVEDFQFFMNPSVADLDGDGRAEVINGSGGFVLHAWNYRGQEPAGWPKFTGQWLIAAPAVGDIDGDGFLEVVQVTRQGFLFAWNTLSPAEQNGRNAVQWSGFHHDNQNTGNFDFPLPRQAGPERAPGCGCDVGASARRGWDPIGALQFGLALLYAFARLRIRPQKR